MVLLLPTRFLLDALYDMHVLVGQLLVENGIHFTLLFDQLLSQHAKSFLLRGDEPLLNFPAKRSKPLCKKCSISRR